MSAEIIYSGKSKPTLLLSELVIHSVRTYYRTFWLFSMLLLTLILFTPLHFLNQFLHYTTQYNNSHSTEELLITHISWFESSAVLGTLLDV